MSDTREPDLESAADRDLAERLRTLPATIEPERDLWPAIAARTVSAGKGTRRGVLQARPTRPMRWLALAAGLLAAAGIGWTVGVRLRPAPVVVEVPFERVAPAATGVAATAYAATGRELDAIRDELRRAIESQRAALPPESRPLVFDNLATIDRAIAEIESALAAAPADADLAKTYVVYRQREIDLLRQANRLAARL